MANLDTKKSVSAVKQGGKRPEEARGGGATRGVGGTHQEEETDAGTHRSAPYELFSTNMYQFLKGM